MQCEMLTKKKRPCPNGDARLDEDGKWKCHVHHLRRTYQKQIAFKRRHIAVAKELPPNPILAEVTEAELILELRARKKLRRKFKKSVDKKSDIV